MDSGTVRRFFNLFSPEPERDSEGDEKKAPENVKVTSALDLMKRLPIETLENNLLGIISLAPEVHEQVVTEFDEPLKVAFDKEAGKEYIICAFNREDDSYRSPWSNTYDPPLDCEVALPEKLRDLEVKANDAFEHYRNMYFGGGVSSVYFSGCADDKFKGVVLLRNTIGESDKDNSGYWESIHCIDIHERPSGYTATYELNSTVTVWMKRNREKTGSFQIGGRIQRYVDETCVLNQTESTHIVNIGQMIENAENNIRLNLNEIFFRRTKVMCEKIYTPVPVAVNPTISREDLNAQIRKAVQPPAPSPRDGHFRSHRREPNGTEVFVGFSPWRK